MVPLFLLAIAGLFFVPSAFRALALIFVVLRDRRRVGLRRDDALPRAVGLRARAARGGRDRPADRPLVDAPAMTEVVTGRFPWAKPRLELLLLALVAVATLTPLAHVTPQDQSRFCLSEALLHGRVSDDRCFLIGYDRASYHGHLYSDKAPGLSFVAMAPVLLLSPGSPARWSTVDMRLWGVRVLTVGVAFLLCASHGRAGERGTGARLRRCRARDVRPRDAPCALCGCRLRARAGGGARLRRIPARMEPTARPRRAGRRILGRLGVPVGPRPARCGRVRGATRPAGARVVPRRSRPRPGDPGGVRLGRVRRAVAALVPVRGQPGRRGAGERAVRHRPSSSVRDRRDARGQPRSGRALAGPPPRGGGARSARPRPQGRSVGRRRGHRDLPLRLVRVLRSVRRGLPRGRGSR